MNSNKGLPKYTYVEFRRFWTETKAWTIRLKKIPFKRCSTNSWEMLQVTCQKNDIILEVQTITMPKLVD